MPVGKGMADGGTGGLNLQANARLTITELIINILIIMTI